MREWYRGLWCRWTHGGGRVERDRAGRISWRCRRCGRWAEPVPLEEERRVVDREIEAARTSRRDACSG